MLTRPPSPAIDGRRCPARAPKARTIVIVNGTDRAMDVVEDVLQSGCYRVVFVEPQARAYSQIKLVRPDLVVMFACLDDDEGFQVLSMLKLDADTRSIPVVTYVTDREHPNEPGEATIDGAETAALDRLPPMRLH